MLHLCYYFYISESIIYSSFMFSCPLWYYPDWQFSQHVCLPVCLSVSLLSVFYGHPLMTHQSLSPLIFFLSSVLCSYINFIWAKKSDNPRVTQPFPRKTRKWGCFSFACICDWVFLGYCKPVVSFTDLATLLVCTNTSRLADSPCLSSLLISITTWAAP